MSTTTPRTMTARYRGRCTTCAGPIDVGAEILHAGRGLVYHAGPCADDRDPDATPTPARSNGRRPSWTSANYGRYYGAGPRGRGRCEDAPCCGCC